LTRPEPLAAFDAKQFERAHALLALRVAHMMGRKLEEEDWSAVYCAAKGIPVTGWSNLNIDVVHGNLGLEHKMLCYRASRELTQACGTTLMHPSLTRSIRIPSVDADADEVMHSVFDQYAAIVAQRREYVAQQSSSGLDNVDLRTGWLVWQTSLRQFLYFEERNTAPDPANYRAKWNERDTGGNRKASKNLWIYEKSSGAKRYSVTTSAGIKIQPYFDVPPPDDPNLYLFTVIGEPLDGGQVRVALTRRTATTLARLIGGLDEPTLSRAITAAVADLSESDATQVPEDAQDDLAFLAVSEEAYSALTESLPGVNDDHCFQLLVDYLSAR
jgi:hypothetical protein